MAGELVTEDWQMEYRGVLLGSGSPFDIVSAGGLLDLPELQTADRLRLRRNGMFPGDDFAGARVVSLQLEVDAEGSTALNETMTTLLDVTRPGLSESALTVQIPGVAGGAKRFMNMRPRRRNVPVNLDFYYGLPMVALEFVATDPRIYDSTNSLAITALPSGGGGLLFPAVPPLTFVASSFTGDVDADNQGTFPVSPVLRIDGPVLNPTVENATAGKTIQLDIDVADGDYLLVDTELRQVLLNGTASRYSSLRATSQWWELAPGVNTIRFRSDTNTEDAVLTVAFNSAWL